MQIIRPGLVRELVNELNDIHGISCRTENLYGEFVVVVDEKEQLREAQKFIGEYSDVIVELPMISD